MELGDDAGQPVGRATVWVVIDVDAAVAVDGQRVQRWPRRRPSVSSALQPIPPRRGTPDEPARRCPRTRCRHVEGTRHSRSRYRYRPWPVRNSRARRSPTTCRWLRGPLCASARSRERLITCDTTDKPIVCARCAAARRPRTCWCWRAAPMWCWPTTSPDLTVVHARQHRDHRRRRRRCAPRPVRGGMTSWSPRWRTASAGWNALSGIPGRPVPPRSRTSAPTAPRSPTPSAGSGCWTAARGTDRLGGAGPRWASATGTACSSTSRSDAVVLEVEFTLDPTGRSAPLRYGELADGAGRRAPGHRPTRCGCARPCWRCAAQGHGARRRRSRHLERRLLLHQPGGARPRRVRAAAATGSTARCPNYPRARRGEAGRRLAGRAGRFRQGLSGRRRIRRGCRPSMRWR